MTFVLAAGVLALVLAIPWWPLGWRGREYWVVAGGLATVVAAIGAIIYVGLTHGLWREAAAQREGGLMLRLIDEYDRLRRDIMHVQEWASECRDEGVDRVDRFAFMATTGLQDFEKLDQARFHVSRFFVRTRKLVRAGFLSEDIVSAALDRAAIESVFLELIDPLDKVKAGESYKTDDREFYTLLRRYPEE